MKIENFSKNLTGNEIKFNKFEVKFTEEYNEIEIKIIDPEGTNKTLKLSLGGIGLNLAPIQDDYESFKALSKIADQIIKQKLVNIKTNRSLIAKINKDRLKKSIRDKEVIRNLFKDKQQTLPPPPPRVTEQLEVPATAAS